MHALIARRSWLLLLSLLTSLLWFGGTSSQAAGTGPSWSVTGIKSVGCAAFGYDLYIHRSGLDSAPYFWHTQVSSGGKIYMNEGFSEIVADQDGEWTLYSDFTYGAVPNPGAYPIPTGQPMKVVLTIERPKGTVLSSWTTVAASCDSDTLLYNGPTEADLDADHVATPTDLCPSVQAFRANGCPLFDRTLTLTAKYGPKRVVGRLYAVGRPTFYAGRYVKIWKVVPDPT